MYSTICIKKSIILVVDMINYADPTSIFYPKIKNVLEMTQYGKNTLKYWHFFPAKIIFFQIMHISLKDVN